MDVFRPAPERSTRANVVRTAAQTAVFWLVFIGVGPYVIARLEGELEIPRFAVAGQLALGIAVMTAMGALNLWSGWVLSVLGRGTPFPTQTARDLVVRGPYRFVRNPMAIGGLGVALGLGLVWGSWGTVAYAIAGGVIWHLIARPMEEADLAHRFGPSYQRYRATVRCWLPRLRPYRP